MRSYGQVVDSIEALPDEQQESLLELLLKRLAERRREALIKSVQEARKEFKAGKIRPASPAKILRKVLA
jgi:dihydroneopterin aldolase